MSTPSTSSSAGVSYPPPPAGVSSPPPPAGVSSPPAQSSTPTAVFRRRSSSFPPAQSLAVSAAVTRSSSFPPPTAAATTTTSVTRDVRVSVQEIIPEADEVANSGHLSQRGRSREECPRSKKVERDDEDLPKEYNSVNLSVLSVIQFFFFLVTIIALLCCFMLEVLKKRKVFGLEPWRWVSGVSVFVCGRLVVGWGIRMGLFLMSRIVVLRKSYSYFAYAVRNGMQNCGWLGIILIVWETIFRRKISRDTNARYFLSYMSRIWICFIIGGVIWVGNKFIVMILASSFHVSVYFDRIKKSLFAQHVIERLGRQTPTPLKNDITIDLLHRLNRKNISSWNMKRLVKKVRKGVISIRQEDDQKMNITSEYLAKSAAKKIFLNVAKQGSKHIYWEDLIRFMPEDEASKTLDLFEVDGTNQENGISKRTFKNWVITAFKERKALALSLDGSKTAVNKLHKILNIVAGTLIVVACLVILKVATTHFFIFFGSQVLLATYMFGNTFKTTLESIIFLFVLHPFDVGDRVEIDGVELIVDEMSLLKTAFLKTDNLRLYYPNNILSTKPIYNFYRSPDMEETIDFCIHISTSGEKIAVMKERITRYVDNRSDHWHPAPLIVMKDIEDLNKLKFSIWITHKTSFQDMPERWTRRSLLLEEMIKIFRELNMEYSV
ncbi:hypothetical protein ACS0TY_007013 [Phlomoides rotata]